MSTDRPKYDLVVAVMVDGKRTQNIRISPGDALTIGESPSNQIVISDLEGNHRPIFSHRGKFFLRYIDWIDGEMDLATGNFVRLIDVFTAKGIQEGGGLVLRPSYKGVLTDGNKRILFRLKKARSRQSPTQKKEPSAKQEKTTSVAAVTMDKAQQNNDCEVASPAAREVNYSESVVHEPPASVAISSIQTDVSTDSDPSLNTVTESSVDSLLRETPSEVALPSTTQEAPHSAVFLFLRDLGLEQYAALLEAEYSTLKQLRDAKPNDDGLRSIGISSFFHRRKILKAIPTGSAPIGVATPLPMGTEPSTAVTGQVEPATIVETVEQGSDSQPVTEGQNPSSPEMERSADNTSVGDSGLAQSAVPSLQDTNAFAKSSPVLADPKEIQVEPSNPTPVTESKRPIQWPTTGKETGVFYAWLVCELTVQNVICGAVILYLFFGWTLLLLGLAGLIGYLQYKDSNFAAYLVDRMQVEPVKRRHKQGQPLSFAVVQDCLTGVNVLIFAVILLLVFNWIPAFVTLGLFVFYQSQKNTGYIEKLQSDIWSVIRFPIVEPSAVKTNEEKQRNRRFMEISLVAIPVAFTFSYFYINLPVIWVLHGLGIWFFFIFFLSSMQYRILSQVLILTFAAFMIATINFKVFLGVPIVVVGVVFVMILLNALSSRNSRSISALFLAGWVVSVNVSYLGASYHFPVIKKKWKKDINEQYEKCEDNCTSVYHVFNPLLALERKGESSYHRSSRFYDFCIDLLELREESPKKYLKRLDKLKREKLSAEASSKYESCVQAHSDIFGAATCQDACRAAYKSKKDILNAVEQLLVRF